MNAYPADDDVPLPTELAGYVDGELDPAARRRVEAWLAAHPEAAREVEGQRRLQSLWHEAAPADPGEAAWAGVLARVEAGLATTPRARRAWLRWLAGLGAAAAVLLGVLGSFRTPGEDDDGLPLRGPFPVASAHEVEIISIDAADVRTLVVGEPPLREPVVLAAVGDVKLRSVEPDDDGMMPDVRIAQGPTVPMIVAPLDTAPAREP